MSISLWDGGDTGKGMQCEQRHHRITSLACFILHVTLVYSYEANAQNGFTNIPKQLKIDEGYYGKGFYFTRFPRFNDELRMQHVVSHADPALPQVQRLL